MYDWDWDKIAEYYQQRQERDSHQSECWAGMLMVGSQLRSDPDFLEFGKTVFKYGLVIGLKDLPHKVPPGFPTGIGVHWIAHNEFQISIFVHETVRVPHDKVIPAIKLYLSRVKRLVSDVRITDKEFEILSAAYRNRTKEDLKLLYSKLPLEWLASTQELDISNELSRLMRIVSRFSYLSESGDVDSEKISELKADLFSVRDKIMDILDTVREIETKYRSERFFEKNP